MQKNNKISLNSSKIWRNFSDLPKEKEVPAIVLSLEDEALVAALKLEEEEISVDYGVETIVTRCYNYN